MLAYDKGDIKLRFNYSYCWQNEKLLCWFRSLLSEYEKKIYNSKESFFLCFQGCLIDMIKNIEAVHFLYSSNITYIYLDIFKIFIQVNCKFLFCLFPQTSNLCTRQQWQITKRDLKNIFMFHIKFVSFLSRNKYHFHIYM